MAFTPRIGVIPGSQLGNLELGSSVASLPAPIVQVVPVGTGWFIGQVGEVMSKAANVVPGRAFMRLRGINTLDPSFSSSMIPSTNFLTIVKNKLLYVAIGTVYSQLRSFTLKVVNAVVSQVDTQPSSLDLTIREIIPVDVDMTNYLSNGDSVSTPIATLKMSTGYVMTGWEAASVSVNGNIVQIPILGSALAVGQSYDLYVQFVANTNKTLETHTTLNVMG